MNLQQIVPKVREIETKVNDTSTEVKSVTETTIKMEDSLRAAKREMRDQLKGHARYFEDIVTETENDRVQFAQRLENERQSIMEAQVRTLK